MDRRCAESHRDDQDDDLSEEAREAVDHSGGQCLGPQRSLLPEVTHVDCDLCGCARHGDVDERQREDQRDCRSEGQLVFRRPNCRDRLRHSRQLPEQQRNEHPPPRRILDRVPQRREVDAGELADDEPEAEDGHARHQRLTHRDALDRDEVRLLRAEVVSDLVPQLVEADVRASGRSAQPRRHGGWLDVRNRRRELRCADGIRRDRNGDIDAHRDSAEGQEARDVSMEQLWRRADGGGAELVHDDVSVAVHLECRCVQAAMGDAR